MKKNDINHSDNLLDILRGYSEIKSDDIDYYFRHFSVVELLRLDQKEQTDIKRSVKKGIKTQKELLESAIEAGSWSVGKEEKLKSTQWMIKRSEAALSKIEDPTQRSIFNKQIEAQRKELKVIENARSKIVAYSAEFLAQTKKINLMGKGSVFKDEEFKEPISDEESEKIVIPLFLRYNELNNRENLIRASYFGGFFDAFIFQSKSPILLFGQKTFMDLTSLQKYMLSLSHALLNKMQNMKIPPEIAGDPVKILDYEEKEEKGEKSSHGLDDLKAKKKLRGGKLKPEDFLS